VLIVQGLYNSSEHWQTRWRQRYSYFERVEQARWDQPQLEVLIEGSPSDIFCTQSAHDD